MKPSESASAMAGQAGSVEVSVDALEGTEPIPPRRFDQSFRIGRSSTCEL